MSKIKMFAAFAVFASLHTVAAAEVITFDGLAGTNMSGNSSRNAATNGTGFTSFSANKVATVGDYSFVDDFVHAYMGASIGGVDGLGSLAWNGTDFLRAFQTTMSSSKAFSVESIDLAQYGSSRLFVRLTGTRQDGSTVSQLISNDVVVDNRLIANDFKTYALSGFTDLTSFRFATGTSYFAADNIRIAEQAVPEPGILAMLGIGLAGVAASRRRRR